MMQNFRRNTRVILFIVVAAFALLIFFQWGLDITGITQREELDIARVDGVPIAYTDYVRFAQNKEKETKGISREEIWNMMLEEVIWNNLIKKENIRIVDEEIWAIIKSNPPREVYESEYMKDSTGKFDYNKYLELLKSPQSRQWLLEYEFNLKKQLPREKLRSLIYTMAWSSPFEDSINLSRYSVLYSFSFISLPLFRLRGKTEITDGELKEYYNKHIKDFSNPETKILKYVFFEKIPSAGDSTEARDRLEDLLLRVREGEDFLTVAREVSDDTLIEKKFKDEKELLPYEADVYKKLKDGEVSNIILTSRGYEVIKRAGTGIIYSAKVNIDVSQTTIGELNDRIESFKNSVRELGFEEAAKEYNLSVHKTMPLNPEKINFPVRNQDGLAKALKRLKPKSVIGPFSSFGGYYLFTLDSIIPEKVLSLNNDNEKAVIRSRYERERLKTSLNDYLNNIFIQLQSGTTMEKIVEQDTTLFFQTNLNNLALTDIESRYGPEFTGVLAALEKGQISKPLITEWAGYIIRCDDKTVIQFDTSMVKYIQYARQMRFQNLSVSIFTPKRIIDNRDKFFE
uniref:Periplasmic chaperone PpiD n=1 Tax=candidate division WOR-3 bacterium TaxID=2052148 RepID=A0A7V1EH90_UNCW3